MDNNHLVFDFQSSTPCSTKVVEEMAPYWNELWGNPSNNNNRSGVFASAAVEVSREKIASYLNINPKRLIFTSGATEANNLGLVGHARAKAQQVGKPGHIITVSTEHHAVLDPLRQLQKEGFSLSELKPNKDGLINIEKLSEAVEKDTFLVSVMTANNEIGVLQPISEIGSFCKRKGIAFHTDAAQALGYLDLEPDKFRIDFCCAGNGYQRSGSPLLIAHAGSLIGIWQFPGSVLGLRRCCVSLGYLSQPAIPYRGFLTSNRPARQSPRWSPSIAAKC